MEIKHFNNRSSSPKKDIIDLFQIVDEYAEKNTYNTSTADMSRDMFFDNADNITDRRALEKFYSEYMGEVIVAYIDEILVGFTIFREEDPYFKELLPSKNPHIAINFSGVHPEYQRQGIWTELRDYLENEIIIDRNVDYILTATPIENNRSKNGNISRGFKIEKKISELADKATVLLSKEV
jgi:ribosomal protein S18 acetylase RimI-like enzyme